MIRIARDHGVLRSAVGREQIEEMWLYAANYKYEDDLQAKANAKENQGR